MGISGFEPSFLVGIDAVRTVHGSRLVALAGKRLAGFALVRFAEEGDWFADCPVVLDFDGARMELCHWKVDELSISWDTIDTAEAIGGWQGTEFTPVWSRSDERLDPFVGRELREVALLERRPSGRDLAAGTVAVEFVFDTGSVPPESVMDAAAQAVVWYVKRKYPDETDYRWFLVTGHALASPRGAVNPAAVSAWYRAVAMVPAAGGDAASTRQYMIHAKEAADEAITVRPRASERHLAKTY